MAYEVTIGIPVYNVEKYIRLTMDSALAQTFESIEFLVLDDCGTDRSMDIVREYQNTHPRGKDIRIVRQPQNMGIGAGRNRIVDEAQGKYLYFLDADDIIEPNTIELLYDSARKFDAELVYGSYERIEEYGEEVKRVKKQYPNMQFIHEDAFADYAYQQYNRIEAMVWNILIDIEVFRKNRIYFEQINYWEDFCVTINLPLYIHRAVLLSDITYFYYCRYGSLSIYEKRSHIEKEEILKTIHAMGEVKHSYLHVLSKPYFHKWLYKVMKTHFYIVCTILAKKEIISPAFTKREIRDVMISPLSFAEICKMKAWRLRIFCLFTLGILPPLVSVSLMWILGKIKRLV
jgi:glycosyltransferase involved in cell wall biosynthesis